MQLKQISVPIENSHDRLLEVTRELGERGINLRAINLVDTKDFGLFRFLVSDLTAAQRVLMQRQITARVDNVVAVEIPDRTDALASILTQLRNKNIRINYTYALAGSGSGNSVMIFHFSDNSAAIDCLQANGVKITDLEALDIRNAQN